MLTAGSSWAAVAARFSRLVSPALPPRWYLARLGPPKARAFWFQALKIHVLIRGRRRACSRPFPGFREAVHRSHDIRRVGVD